MENNPQHLIPAHASPDRYLQPTIDDLFAEMDAEETAASAAKESYHSMVNGLGRIGEERKVAAQRRTQSSGPLLTGSYETSNPVTPTMPASVTELAVPQPTAAEIAAHEASVALAAQQSSTKSGEVATTATGADEHAGMAYDSRRRMWVETLAGRRERLAAERAAKKLEAAAKTNMPRSEELNKLDIAVNNRNAFDKAHNTSRIRGGRTGRRIGSTLLAGALAGSAFLGSAVGAGAEQVPAAAAQEQTTPDAGFFPYPSQDAEDASKFGSTERLNQLMFGNAQRSWEIEGKLSADKVGKPMDVESTNKAFEDLITDARTNADVYAQLMVGCDDKLDCTDLDKLAAEYDAATPAERQEKYEALKNRLDNAELDFETWNNYGTTFTNTETKSVNWNNDRRTDGVKVLRITLPNGETFHIVTECEQLGFQSEQAEQKKLHALPMVGATVTVETTTYNPESPTNIPDISIIPESPTDETTPSEEENPEEEGLEEKDEEDNFYNNANEQLQNGDDRFENSPETPDRSGDIEAERGTEPARPVGEGAAEGTTPVAPETQEQNEQIQPEQGTNTELTPEQQQELIDQGAGELEDGNNGRVSE